MVAAGGACRGRDELGRPGHQNDREPRWFPLIARAASPQALLFLTSLPNHKAWWPQEARVAAEMNSAALGRPWPLFQPTCRPVGTLSSPVDSQVPRHIGIIMDGNGRWARRRGRPASFGHRAGVRAIKRALQACEDLGVHTLSIYAFST